MRMTIAIIVALLLTRQGVAQLQPQDAASSVQFKIKNFGFNTTGVLTGLAGKIRFDPARVGDAAFDVTADAGTINTDNGMRDDHLRKEDYFNVAVYPRIRLVSGKIGEGKKGVFLFSGQLTIKDRTKDVSFPFTAEPEGGGIRFKGAFTINRKDFNVGGTSTISNELQVDLNVLAK